MGGKATSSGEELYKSTEKERLAHTDVEEIILHDEEDQLKQGGVEDSVDDQGSACFGPLSGKAAELHVFSSLRCTPSSVALVPLASAAVVCMGGPRSVTNRTFSIEDEKVATVDRDGIVTAVNVGVTTVLVKYSAAGSSSSLLDVSATV